jgi:Domain of unknown function (DUF4258)
VSETLRRVQTLVLRESVRISDHGLDELRKDAIVLEDVIAGVYAAKAIEDYSDRARGPSVLTLQRDANGRPIRAVWAIPARQRGPAVLVTSYRPDPALWDEWFESVKHERANAKADQTHPRR